MKAIYDREGLLNAFKLTSSVVTARKPKAVLKNVKAVCTDTSSTLVATDLEAVGLRMEVRGVKVDEPGEALLPTEKLSQILRECSDKEIAIEADPAAVWVRGEHSEFELPSDDPTQYPDFPSFEGENYHQVQAGQLREMIGRTLFAAAVESPRYALTGVLWELVGDKICLVATDGRRLAVADGIAIAHGSHSTEGQFPVVPTKAMNLLERNLIDPDEQILVAIRSNEVLFKAGRANLYGRLVEGRYPPYRSPLEVFQKKINSQVIVGAGQLLAVVRQAAILTDQESRGVDFQFAENKLTLRIRAEKGRAKVELPISYDHAPITIKMDPRFVSDMVRTIPHDAEIQLNLADGNTPVLFRVGNSYRYVVMPLTTGGSA